MKQATNDSRAEAPLPRIDRWLMGGFENHFLPRYLKKHFHTVALNRESLRGLELAASDAMVVYANHASWWDPMTAIFLRNRVFTEHRFYAPIDAEALARYRIFRRMGFFGVAQGSRRGALDFLRSSLRIIQQPGASIWLTPEGRFCDSRDTRQALMPGLAHLAASIPQTPMIGKSSKRVWFVPVAVEYVFWEERLPECLAWIGQPVLIEWAKTSVGNAQEPVLSKSNWSERLNGELRAAQQSLAAASIARESNCFESLLIGRAGTWRWYDLARRLIARMGGKTLPMEHGRKFTH